MAEATAPTEGVDLGLLAGDPDRLLTYPEFAAWVRVPERTARDWANRPGGPRTVRLGKHTRIRVRDALAWLAWLDCRHRTAA